MDDADQNGEMKSQSPVEALATASADPASAGAMFPGGLAFYPGNPTAMHPYSIFAGQVSFHTLVRRLGIFRLRAGSARVAVAFAGDLANCVRVQTRPSPDELRYACIEMAFGAQGSDSSWFLGQKPQKKLPSRSNVQLQLITPGHQVTLQL